LVVEEDISATIVLLGTDGSHNRMLFDGGTYWVVPQPTSVSTLMYTTWDECQLVK